jgi:ribosome maturation factor RimP
MKRNEVEMSLLQIRQIVFVWALALVPALAGAQATGSIAGVVRDSSGGAVPGATVRVVNEATRVAIEAFTDGQGAYRVDGLAAASYRVEAALDGFETSVRQVTLEAGQAAAVDALLEPAKFSQAVVVTARRVEE